MSAGTTWMRGCRLASLLVCVAGAVYAGTTIEDVWGSPLTAGQLVELIPDVLSDIPIRNVDTLVRWCDEPWCAIRVEVDNRSWPASPLAVLVGSVMNTFHGTVTLDVGRAVPGEPEAAEDSAGGLCSTPLTAAAVAIVQGYTIVAPLGVAVPALAIATVAEKDGVVLEVLRGSASDSDGLSVSPSVFDAAGASTYTFH